MRWATLVAALVAAPRLVAAQAQPIDVAKAKEYFDQAHALCTADGGKLWGKSLCGPMILADPRTRTVAADQSDAESRLRLQDGVYLGTLPAEVNIANTSTAWAGVRWIMIMWPLPASPTARARLLMHESFHRIQDELGLPASSPANAHLGTLEGRIWLGLEWRALGQALARPDAPSTERKRAIEDALLFRTRRQALFANAKQQETALELNEGLAEYTGYKLRGTTDAATMEAAIQRLVSSEDDSSFSRSFAYASGPAYGLLLDLAGVSWRKSLTSESDLGEILQRAYGVQLRSDIAGTADQRAALYDGGALRWLERSRSGNVKQSLPASNSA